MKVRRRIKPAGFWTYDNCLAEAKKYPSLGEYAYSSASSYGYARRAGWLDKLSDVLSWSRKPVGYWTVERIIKEAGGYRTRAEFRINSRAAYRAASKLGVLDTVCHGLLPGYGGKARPRFVYMIKAKMPNGWQHIYVGLSTCVDRRLRQHVSKGMIQVRVLLAMPEVSIVILNEEKPLPEKEAATLERLTVASYATRKRCLVLNLDHGGGLGRSPPRKWSLAEIRKEANRYTIRTHFYRKARAVYQAAESIGKLDAVCKHMKPVDVPYQLVWTPSAIRAEAKKYMTRRAFFLKAKGAYAAATREGILDSVCKHMNTKPKYPAGFWTKAKVIADAKRFGSKKEWRDGSPSFHAAKRLGVFELASKHMPKRAKF